MAKEIPTKETHFHPEAIRLMRVRHKLQALFTATGMDKDEETHEIIDELNAIEMMIYEG